MSDEESNWIFLKILKTHLTTADKGCTMKQTVEDIFVFVVAGMCVLAAVFVQFLKGML